MTRKYQKYQGSHKKIFLKALIVFVLSFLFICLLIFIPAGTLHFFNGWLYLGGLFVPMFITMIYLLIRDPELLEKRLRTREKEQKQKNYIRLSLILYLIAYIIPGLDYRFNWSGVPMWLVFISLIIMLLSYVMFIIVMLQNRYASRVIEIQQEQKLIDNGLYSIVRHPMYLSATMLYLSSILVLGSYYAMIPMLLLPVLLAYRIKNEEKVLKEGLPGYDKYMKKVKYRMIPFIW